MLTDVVKSHGGSSELVAILNRLGAIASEDTHSRLVTYVAEKREEELLQELTPNAFCVASTDNVDIVPTYASVYAGKSTNSWHGTSIQYIEPKPKSLVSRNVTPLEKEGVAHINMFCAVSDKTRATSSTSQ